MRPATGWLARLQSVQLSLDLAGIEVVISTLESGQIRAEFVGESFAEVERIVRSIDSTSEAPVRWNIHQPSPLAPVVLLAG